MVVLPAVLVLAERRGLLRAGARARRGACRLLRAGTASRARPLA